MSCASSLALCQVGRLWEEHVLDDGEQPLLVEDGAETEI